MQVLGVNRRRLVFHRFLWPLSSHTPHVFLQLPGGLWLACWITSCLQLWWDGTRLFSTWSIGRRQSCCFSLLLCLGVPREEPWLTRVRQGKIHKTGHLKRCKWQWELEGFSVPPSPLGMEIQRSWKFSIIMQWHIQFWYVLQILRRM